LQLVEKLAWNKDVHMKYPSRILIALLILLSSSFPGNANKPALQLATIYQPPKNISRYWVSEKLDGIRGYWSGKQLFTRRGNLIHTPLWFTEKWSTTPLDGELWIARNKFEQTVSCVRKKTPNDQCWKNIKFMVFDMPKHHGTFSERIDAMNLLGHQIKSPYLMIIKQEKMKNIANLQLRLKKLVEAKGEGLMLQFEDAHYKQGRSHDLMKLKDYQDDDAIVLGYTQGKGKYKGMLGALLVKTSDGIIFRIGTGFTDKQRKHPPQVGSTITYKYVGKTQKGVPRFASFIHVRDKL
jgi:DNA ligase-1